MDTAVRQALRTITPNEVAAPVLLAGGIYACTLPSPERKVRKTLHQQQLDKQIRSKRKAAHAQAHAHVTTLVAEERVKPKPKDVCRTTVQVRIQQTDGELRTCGYSVKLSKPTINQYVALSMVCTFPLAQGYEGTMPPHTFYLLMLTAESIIQINQVNIVVVEQTQILTKVKKCCGVPAGNIQQIGAYMTEC
jgi:hypothetical protein